MRKFLCALFAAALLLGSARSEGAFVPGAGAASLGESLFFAVPEGETQALVRVFKEKPMLALRADGLDSLLVFDGALYYLQKEKDAWALMARGESAPAARVHQFPDGADVRGLSAWGGEMFVLVDDRLNVLYPQRGLCLRLAEVRMRSYVIYEDYAYFVSATDIVRYDLSASVYAEGGCLYRLNISTGNTSLVIKAGAEDIALSGSRLYFHNLSEAYLQGAERAAGKLYAFDLNTEQLFPALDDYDWGYFPAGDDLLVRRAEGVWRVGADGETLAWELSPRALVFFQGGAVFAYDPDAGTFAARLGESAPGGKTGADR